MDPTSPDLEPIAGVTITEFVAVSVDLARFQFDVTRAADVAEEHGIAPDAWADAAEGWSHRLRSNVAVADEFERLYRSTRAG